MQAQIIIKKRNGKFPQEQIAFEMKLYFPNEIYNIFVPLHLIFAHERMNAINDNFSALRWGFFFLTNVIT